VAGELETIIRNLFKKIDAGDFKGLGAQFTDDAQGVDEISRRWTRGRAELDAYFGRIESAVKDVRSEIRDVRESIYGQAGIVTCWVEQDYTLDGKRQHVSAPTTVAFRRDGPGWKILLFHSIPLPESAS
jgi:ketosteroid isomerase-like protein